MTVPEYRRFIAYFYEYIDGKKQKNAGFAKVELRNGMWRILFRLMTEALPEPPMQVYGFVRTEGYLLGVPMGTIRSGREIAEEWAYQAETPIGKTDYRLEDLAGIRVVSGDGRCFLTVWDDEPVKPEQFVLELPREEAADTVEVKTALVQELPEEPQKKMAVEPETAVGDAVKKDEIVETTDAGRGDKASEPADAAEEASISEPVYAAEEASILEPVYAAEEASLSKAADSAGDIRAAGNFRKERAMEKPLAEKVPERSRPSQSGIEELFRMRSHFQPFADMELTNCVMIMPCDIIRLQQEHWQVGRSSFLQHGFYQHRHLLLGMDGDGGYVVGVPGIRNPQEQYMAEMFGFGRFKASKIYECGKVFGYWCRTLQKMP